MGQNERFYRAPVRTSDVTGHLKSDHSLNALTRDYDDVKNVKSITYQVFLKIFGQGSNIHIEVINAIDVGLRLKVYQFDFGHVDSRNHVEHDGALRHLVSVQGHVDRLSARVLSLVCHCERLVAVVLKRKKQ